MAFFHDLSSETVISIDPVFIYVHAKISLQDKGDKMTNLLFCQKYR